MPPAKVQTLTECSSVIVLVLMRIKLQAATAEFIW
jgi:hypothetical protein